MDFIAIQSADPSNTEFIDYGYTHRGNPTTIKAPLTPGNYVVRYLTGRQYNALAERPIRVDPPKLAPGRLEVLLPTGTSAAIPGGSAVELILDASGSMLKRLDGKRRIDIAKNVLIDVVRNQLPEGTPLALRVFGHREADSCRTDLEQSLAPLDAQATATRIQAIEAKNLAKTPIADSLAMVANDLAAVTGQRIVILLTDGEETCGGNPSEVIANLKASGIDVRVNIVGFAIDDANLAQTFRLWAELGDGSYFDADGADKLARSMTEALRVPFDAIGADGQVSGSGLVGGDAIVLPAGTYRVQTRENPPRTVAEVVISPEEKRTITLSD
jgi:hypothetical protein